MIESAPNTDQTNNILGIHNGLEPWDQSVASVHAMKEGIQLTEAHFDVLMFLRQCHHKHGMIRHARSLTQALDIRFADKGGLKYLYQLFPNGPVTQGCKLAGIPVPGDASDRSFGTVQ